MTSAVIYWELESNKGIREYKLNKLRVLLSFELSAFGQGARDLA
jgi:hypothetical protein